MYTYLYIYVYLSIYMHTYCCVAVWDIYICIYIYICIFKIFTCICTLYVYIYTHVYMYLCVCACVCVCVYIEVCARKSQARFDSGKTYLISHVWTTQRLGAAGATLAPLRRSQLSRSEDALERARWGCLAAGWCLVSRGLPLPKQQERRTL